MAAAPGNVDHLLEGAIDPHLHPAPSPFPRKVDISEAAAQYAEVGFTDVIVKSHHHSMVPDLQATTWVSGDLPLRVHAGVTINDYIGGYNAAAVELALEQGGRIVWLPTMSSPAHIEAMQGDLKFPKTDLKLRGPQPILTLDDDGKLRSEVLEVLSLIREADAILAGGHLSAAELEVVVPAAVEMGIKRIVINHPNYIVDASIEQCAKWAELGAIIEHSFSMFIPSSVFYQWDVDELLRYVNAAGVQNTALGSDLGQPGNPLPVDGFREIVAALVEADVSESDIRALVGGTARRLLE